MGNINEYAAKLYKTQYGSYSYLGPQDVPDGVHRGAELDPLSETNDDLQTCIVFEVIHVETSIDTELPCTTLSSPKEPEGR